MLLSDKDIINLLESKEIEILPVPENLDIGPCSVNLRLSKTIKKYTNETLDLKNKDTFQYEEIVISDLGYTLKPSEFILGSTVEEVRISDEYYGFIETKGSIARAGLQIHNTDGHIDPGFRGNITLEITNNSNQPIIIYPDIKIAQISFMKLSSKCLNPYKGKYQNQKGPTVYK
jgi:dCTP deaminase